MNNKILILILILVIIVLYFLYEDQENLDSTSTTQNLSNEAIQNIASVYNNQNMKVTNLESTGILKGNIINASSINTSENITAKNVYGTLSSDNSNNYVVNMQSNGDLCIYDKTAKKNIWVAGKNGTVSSPEYKYIANMQDNGDLCVLDTSTGKNIWCGGKNGWGGNSIVLDAPAWYTGSFVQLIANGNYFNKDMPDGTRINFMFVFPNKVAANSHIWNGVAVKMGKQFLLYQISPTHTDVGNVFTNASNNGEWRGNIG